MSDNTEPRPLTDLIGLDPDFTEGLSTDEYLRRMRCGECDEALKERDTAREVARSNKAVTENYAAELEKVTAERDEARNAVLELGDAIIRANGWEPQNGVTVELSSALERLVVQRDLLREGRDQYRKNWATARQQAEQAQAERDAAYAALKAIDEHVTGMWTEIGDHQDHDYDVNDHDETLQAGRTAGRDAEHERITYDLRELLDNDAVRLATGVTCQPGQPWSCGDAHTAGHCVRPNASAAVPKADPISDDDTRCHLMDRENRNRDLVHSRKCWCQVAAPKADEHKANACICDTWREETPFGFSTLIGADATCPVHGEEPLPAAAPDPASTRRCASKAPCDGTPGPFDLLCDRHEPCPTCGSRGTHDIGCRGPAHPDLKDYLAGRDPEPLPAAAPDPAACIADDPDHAGMTCDQYDAALDVGPAPADGGEVAHG